MKVQELAKTYGLMYDDESDILNTLREALCTSSVVCFNGNSFERHIRAVMKKQFGWIDNSGHSANPPDFYSDKYDIMFDVTRVNASEVSRTYNPIKIKERDFAKQLEQNGLTCDSHPDVKVVCFPGSTHEDDYTYEKYKKSAHRVITKHINKIPIWQSEHPNIHCKGLVIFDESECCFEGIIHIIDAKNCFFGVKQNKPLVLHEPWNDKEFIDICYHSALDFVVWYCPYKPYGDLPRKFGIKFPEVVIIDVRHQRTKPYIQYNAENLVVC